MASRSPLPTRLNSGDGEEDGQRGKDDEPPVGVVVVALLEQRPQLGAGGCTPNPSRLSPASVMMAPAMPNGAATRAGDKALGRMWRKMIRRSRRPGLARGDVVHRPLLEHFAADQPCDPGQPVMPITTMMM